ncbi:MAG: site-specific integrase [Bacteroidales bacterium]|nr:site-specific integrase [Bacteroidales bacterium]
MKKVIGQVRLAVALNTKYGRDDIYPVAVRVYFNGQRKYYNVDAVFCKERLWQYFFTTRVIERKADAEKVKDYFNKIASHVAFLVETGMFSFANLDEAIQVQKVRYSFDYVDEVAAFIESEKRGQQKYNTAATYHGLVVAMEKCYSKRVRIYDVNESWLKDFEARLVEQGCSAATIGIRMRTLKHVFNTLIKMNVLPQKLYPFSNYVMPKATRRKLALGKELLDKLKENRGESEHLRLWLLSYYMQGINFCDMLRLRKSNFEFVTGTIRFHRLKTSGRTKFNEETVIPITDNILEVLSTFINFSEWKRLPGNPYLLPHLNESMDENEKWRRTRTITKAVNKKLKKVCPEGRVTTYSARHTFTSNMLQLGASLEDIAMCLGHTSTNTTRYYLQGLDYSTIAGLTSKL